MYLKDLSILGNYVICYDYVSVSTLQSKYII